MQSIVIGGGRAGSLPASHVGQLSAKCAIAETHSTTVRIPMIKMKLSRGGHCPVDAMLWTYLNV